MKGRRWRFPKLRFLCGPWCLSGTRYLPAPWWFRLSPCNPCRTQEEQTSTCSPWRIPRLDQVDAQNRLWPYGKLELEQASGRTIDSMERGVHTRASFLGGSGILQGSHTRRVCSWRTAPQDRHMFNQFIKNCSPQKDLLWRSLWRTLSCERDAMLGMGGKSVRSSLFAKNLRGFCVFILPGLNTQVFLITQLP